jgi:hypothetical protein
MRALPESRTIDDRGLVVLPQGTIVPLVPHGDEHRIGRMLVRSLGRATSFSRSALSAANIASAPRCPAAPRTA